MVTYMKHQWVGRNYAWKLLDHCSLCIFWYLVDTYLFLLRFLHVIVDWISSNHSQNKGYCVINTP